MAIPITVSVQRQTEDEVRRFLARPPAAFLDVAHATFNLSNVQSLPSWAISLDASRPWICFWIVHSIALLNQLSRNEELCDNIVSFLGRCQHPDGGFGGGPGQLPHLAPTYAAIMALCEIGSDRALKVIDRPKLLRFLLTRKDPSGGFTMHHLGEIDIRGAYCALASAAICNILTEELILGVREWIISCQTYEGGFGGEPANEAHGGYAFCGTASLILLGGMDLRCARRILRWAVNRQMAIEGGFQGRTNKLVDSCYSYWVGGIIPLLDLILYDSSGRSDRLNSRPSNVPWLFNAPALQSYLLQCCQSQSGGFKDKPSKSPDLYHTCYSLSGLAICQHQPIGELSPKCAVLQPLNPLFNILQQSTSNAFNFFQGENDKVFD